MLIPIGHEQDTARRYPWVSVALVAACVAFFAYNQPRKKAHARAAEHALEFFVEHPDLKLDPQLGRMYWGDSTDEIVEELRSSGRPSGSGRGQQARLDELTETWRRAKDDDGTYSLGLVAADYSILNLVTSIFMHAGWMHLIGNLIFLWMSGPPLEDVWGRPVFVAFFFGCGIVANLFWVVRYPDSQVPLVGASGAIAGLMGAFMVRFWSSRIRMLFIFGVIGSFTAPAWLLLGLWFGRELLASTDSGAGGGVAYWVHVGGFFFGALVALAVKRYRIEDRFLAPEIDKILGAETNPVIDQAYDLRQAGRPEEARRLLEEELRRHPDNYDAAFVLWDLAVKQLRPRIAFRQFLHSIEGRARVGDPLTAFEHLEELRKELPDQVVPLNVILHLAEALQSGRHHDYAAQVLELVDEGASRTVPDVLLARLAKAAGTARTANALALCKAALARERVPPALQGDLRKLVWQLDVAGSSTAEEELPAVELPEPDNTATAAAPEAPGPPAALPDLAAEPTADSPSRIVVAGPIQLTDEGVTVRLPAEGQKQLSFAQIRAVATARISPFELGAKSFDLIDLVVGDVVFRLLVQAFDPRVLIPKAINQEDALTELVEEILTRSGAPHLTQQPFASFLSERDYEERILGPVVG